MYYDTLDQLNDVDIVVFGLTTDELQEWLDMNGYDYDNIHGNFILKDYRIDISVGNKLLIMNPLKNHAALTLQDNIDSRDCTLNSLLFNPRDYNVYGTDQMINDFKNYNISTRMTNLSTVFRFRCTFFFRMVKLMIRLSIQHSRVVTIDKIIWEKMSMITRVGHYQMSIGWSTKFNESLSDAEFIEFMNIIQEKTYLIKFIRPAIWKRWVDRIQTLTPSYNIDDIVEAKINPFAFDINDFPTLGNN
jgi:hypothetical protein